MVHASRVAKFLHSSHDPNVSNSDHFYYCLAFSSLNTKPIIQTIFTLNFELLVIQNSNGPMNQMSYIWIPTVLSALGSWVKWMVISIYRKQRMFNLTNHLWWYFIHTEQGHSCPCYDNVLDSIWRQSFLQTKNQFNKLVKLMFVNFIESAPTKYRTLWAGKSRWSMSARTLMLWRPWPKPARTDPWQTFKRWVQNYCWF